MATGCSSLDRISSFPFSLEIKPKIVRHILGYYVRVCYILFSDLSSLVNNLVYITYFTPKTMDFFMLGSTDNTISITQIHQGVRCQEALFMKEDIWAQDIYSASKEVQRKQERALSYPLHFAAQRTQKPSKCQPAWVKTDYLPCVICWNPGIKVSRTQCFKKTNPSRQRHRPWFQQHFFFLLNKTLWVRLQMKTVSIMSVHLLIEHSHNIFLRHYLLNHTVSYTCLTQRWLENERGAALGAGRWSCGTR